jgi:hypothetical protein
VRDQVLLPGDLTDRPAAVAVELERVPAVVSGDLVDLVGQRAQ